MACPIFHSVWQSQNSFHVPASFNPLLIPLTTDGPEELYTPGCSAPQGQGVLVSHSDGVIEKQIADGLLRPELRERVSYVLLRKHRHQTKKPIHRSLVDIGKSVSSTTSESGLSLADVGAGVRPWCLGEPTSVARKPWQFRDFLDFMVLEEL